MAPHIRWFQRFELERDNVREVLEWSLSQGDVRLGVRLAGAIWLFWFAYGHHVEGLRWTQRLLVHLSETPKSLHAKFLIGAGNMTIAQEALSLFRELNHQPGIAHTLNVVGEIARQAGDDAHARRAYEECLEVCLKTGETRRVAIVFFNLAFLAQHEGDHTATLDVTRRALQIACDMNNRGEMAWCLPIIAGSMAALGQPQRAARLLGTSEFFLERLGAFILPADKHEFERIRTEVCAPLPPLLFDCRSTDLRAKFFEVCAVGVH